MKFITNILGNLTSSADLHYVIESKEWSIYWDGRYITENLKGLIKTRLTTTPWGIRNSIIHFGSLSTLRDVHLSNKVVLTCFHVAPNDARVETTRRAWKYIDIVHTSNKITMNKLIEMGASQEKTVVIPLGVDLGLFKPVSPEEKQRIRRHLGIPEGAIVIGNFMKDGTGWNAGMEPKWIKGADVFADVVGELKRVYGKDIFVLLTGAARGHMKKELEKRGVPYKHVYTNYQEIPKYYNALDLYIVTSRVEGGPKAILEYMASGVPIVSTRCGMAPEVIQDGVNGMLADVDDRAGLLEKSLEVIENWTTAKTMVMNGIWTAKNHSWKKIAERYYNEIYSRLL